MKKYYLLLFYLLCIPVLSPAGTENIEYEYRNVPIGKHSYSARLPKGYAVEFLTGELDGPRMLSFAANGDMFIGSKSGRVYRLTAPYTKPQVYTQLRGYPHSVAIRDESIFIARTDALFVGRYIPGQATLSSKKLKKLISIPDSGGHDSRTIAIGPDRRLYMGLGIAYNCTDQYIGESYPFDDRRGGIMLLDETGGEFRWRAFAGGLRNPVGFDWHPQTRVLYTSNNGPDHLGYELPPEYFSRAEKNSFHGMPWYYFDGQQVRRDNCIDGKPPYTKDKVTKPVAIFPARNAPMGVSFVPDGALDKRFRGDAVVALHGSWAKKPDGGYLGDRATRRPPRLVVVRFEKGRAVRVDDLLSGMQLRNGNRWARPVGVGFGPDGALYFTSDGGTHGLFRLYHDKGQHD